MDALFDSFYAVSLSHRDTYGFHNLLLAYQKARPDAVGPALLQARDLIDSGRDTSNPSGLAADGRERMNAAARTLERAARLSPDDGYPPAQMLTILVNLDSDRETFEKWFERAMEAKPDNFGACSVKIIYLDPGRHHLHEGAEDLRPQ